MKNQQRTGFILSPQQKRLWLMQSDHSLPYRIQAMILLEGRLDSEHLQAALQYTVDRHEILRTTIHDVPGQAFPIQVIAEARMPPIQMHDISDWSQQKQEDWINVLFQEMSEQPFNFAQFPLLRLSLVMLSPVRHILLVILPALCGDRASLTNLIHELCCAYADARYQQVGDKPVQYVDFAGLQNELLESDDTAAERAYWQRQELPGLLDLKLPFETQSPEEARFQPCILSLVLNSDVVAAIETLAKTHKTTMSVFLLSCWYTLLWHLTKQSNIKIGVYYDCRPYEELEKALGLFAKYLPFHCQLEDSITLVEVLAYIDRLSQKIDKHQEYFGFNQIDTPEQPFFAMCFDFQERATNYTAQYINYSIYKQRVCIDRFKIKLSCSHEDNILIADFSYDARLFQREDIERLAEQFQALIGSAIEHPNNKIDTLEIIGPRERHQLLVEFNDTAAEYLRDGLLLLFETQVERIPQQVAVVYDGQHLTYRELDMRANRLAHYLRERGVAPDVLVALCVERSIDLVVGLIGILKAGGAYLPIDPAYPHARRAFMIEDSQAPVVLTQHHMLEQLPSHSAAVVCLDTDWPRINRAPAEKPDVELMGENIFYVVYTSGSTGTPKGVLGVHQGMLNRCRWMWSAYPYEPGETACQKTDLSFVDAVAEIFGPLLQGIQLVIVPNRVVAEPQQFVQSLGTQRVTRIVLVPSLLQALLTTQPELQQNLPDLKIWMTSGEELSPGLAQQFQACLPDRLLLNLYGSSEVSADVTWSEVGQADRRWARAAIGHPIANTQIYVLDRQLQLVPIGVPGELYVGGVQLARGYLHRPALTAERFAPNPFAGDKETRRRGDKETRDAAEPQSAIGNRQSAIGTRLYRTGDLARYRPDGTLEFLGRIDHQVKLRGFRIELNEIETVLRQHPMVRACVVVAHTNTSVDQLLVAYVVPTKAERRRPNDEESDSSFVVRPSSLVADLRTFLAARLPDYMLPATFVLLDALPLLPNRKVDRQALPAPDTARPALANAFVAPQTPVEEILATIWTTMLHIAPLGIHDNFFALGGHSLLATQVLIAVRESFGIEVPLRHLFDTPTIAGLAAAITRAQHDGIKPLPLRSIPRQGPQPLSYAQQRLWLLHQLAPDSPAYNIPVAFYLNGRFSLAAFVHSLTAIMQRHETLRTTFVMLNEQPVQVIAAMQALPLTLIDLRGLPQVEREAVAYRLTNREAERPFDLVSGPLFRAYVLQLAEPEHLLLLNMHHIISDGWSIGVFKRELSRLYGAYIAGQPADLAPLPIQYVDYTIWQRQWLQGAVLRSQLAYWHPQLADLPTLDLPTDAPRPAHSSFPGAVHPFVLSFDLSANLAALSRRYEVSLFMTLLAGWQILLARYSRQEDMVIGTTVANRTQGETEALIGFFVNTLVLRTDLAGDPTLPELLRRVRTMAIAAYAHQDLPFEMLVEALQPARDLSRQPLFQVMFTLQSAPPADAALPGIATRPLDVAPGAAKFDLNLSLRELPRGLIGTLEYRTDLFAAPTIERMLGHFQTLLQSMVAAPEQRLFALPLLTEAEQRQLIGEWNDTTVGVGGRGGSRSARTGVTSRIADACLHELFEAQSAHAPDAVALVADQRPTQTKGEGRRTKDADSAFSVQLTYGELNAHANQLAHYLQTLNVGPESRVGICLERSLELIVAILGILKAGGAYVPLDPAYPVERIAFMLADAGVGVLITDSICDLRLTNDDLGASDTAIVHCTSKIVNMDADWLMIAQQPAFSPATAVQPHNLAYVIYTSGSTGTPKGVLVSHANVARLLSNTQEWFHFNEQHIWTLFHAIVFDFSVWELWGALCYGARLVIVPSSRSRNAEAFYRLLAMERVTVLNQTPSAFRQFMQVEMRAPARPVLALDWVIFGGEALDLPGLRTWFEHHDDQRPRLVNMYGITETTVHVTCRPLTAADPATAPGSMIGRPIADLQLYVLDQQQRLVPLGVPGELYVGGLGLARGYLNRPELTAERFVPNPFATLNAQRETLNEQSVQRSATQRVPGVQRLYRTGDLARYRLTGDFEYLGRIDQQIKIRGYRIDLGEITATLLAHSAVREAVVVLREDGSGERRLIAYVVTTKDEGRKTKDAEGDPSFVPRPSSFVSELRAFLKTRLPSYMLPSAFVLLDTLPLTHSGKIDRRALSAPDSARPELVTPFVAHLSPVEELLAAIWCDILALEHVGIDDNFFDLGGHSLLAVQCMSHVRSAFQVELPLRMLFEQPTVADLARQIEWIRRTVSEPQPPIRMIARSGVLPLSAAQQRLWFLDQLQPNSSAYTIPAAVRMTGALDLAALHQSLNTIVQRHEVLRTTFVVEDGRPMQVIGPVAAGRDTIAGVLDLRALPAARREAIAQQLAQQEARRSFDLGRGPLLRVALLRLEDAEHVLLLNMHHIVSDAWSHTIFIRELTALYTAWRDQRPPLVPDLPVQYADYATWQREWLQGEVLEAHLAYWREQLADIPAVELPTDYSRPAGATFRGMSQQVVLPLTLSAQLRKFSRAEGVTLFMTLIAALQVLVARYSGQDDLVIGTPIAGRTRTETEGLIGCFVNTLVLRTRIAGSWTFRELMQHVREVCLGAYAHQELPFEQVVEALQPTRDLSRNPLFQIMFTFQNAPVAIVDLPNLQLRLMAIEQATTQFDVSLSLEETATGLVGRLQYRSDLFASTTIMRFLRHFQALLEGIVAEPRQRLSELLFLNAAERQQVLLEWNDTGSGVRGQGSGVRSATSDSWLLNPDKCLHQLFEAQAAYTPDAIAVVFGDQQLTYDELDTRATQLATLLHRIGIGPNVLVGICLERSLEMIIGLLGILKASGAFLPLDPDYPAARLGYMLRDSATSVLLTHAATLPNVMAGMSAQADQINAIICLDGSSPPRTLPHMVQFYNATAIQAEPGHVSLPHPQAEHLAYVMYTSGSTGRPKGVPIHHVSLVTFFLGYQQYFGQRSVDRVIQYHSLSFDFSTWEIFEALLVGAALHIVPTAIARDVEALAHYLFRAPISVLNMTPSQFSGLSDYVQQTHSEALAALRILVLGGEALSAALAERAIRLVSPNCRVYNEYGPTETTISTSIFRVTHDTVMRYADHPSLPIGRPIANTQLYVLDAQMQLMPIGVPGELYIGGIGLAHGYCNRPELTAERFMPNPFAEVSGVGYRVSEDKLPDTRYPTPDTRLYKTGDLAYYLPDGVIAFVGRTDAQVKLRGYRIELGEIAAVLAQHPDVRECVIVTREDAPGDRRLVAYVVPITDDRPSTIDHRRPPGPSSIVLRPSSFVSGLRSFLKTRLPEYMLPAAFVLLDSLPLTSNGKVDRRALPLPEIALPAIEHTNSTPHTAIEDLLIQIWAAVLRVDQVGLQDNFFMLGGHSLLATQVIARVREIFQVDLPLSSLFEAPTIAGLAARIATARHAGPNRRPPLQPVPRASEMPLSYAQQRLWFLHQLAPDNPVYNVPATLRLSGLLDLPALVQSVTAIVRRHEVLRTVFGTRDGRPYQRITSIQKTPLALIDLQMLVEDVREITMLRLAGFEAQRPFNLAHGPLLRVLLMRLRADEHVVVVTLHHIAADAWSIDLLMRELTALYSSSMAGQLALLPDLPIQYVDYAVWQRAYVQGEVLDAQLAYWTQQLAELPMLRLPTDHPRLPHDSFQGSGYSFLLSPEFSARLVALSRAEGVTLFMLLLAAWQVLLARYSGQDDIVVGTPIANRQQRESEGLVGCFLNTLVLRTRLNGYPTFQGVLRRVRTLALEAYAHQDLPFEMLVETLQPTRDLSRNPLFQVMFVLQNAATDTLELPNLIVQPLAVIDTTAKFDLTLTIAERRGGLSLTLEYNIELFDIPTIIRMSSHFQSLLTGIIAHPQQHAADLPLFSRAERQQLLVEWNDTGSRVKGQGSESRSRIADACLHQLFEVQAARTPDAIAVVAGDRHLSYAVLNAHADHLADHLHTLGVAQETHVGLCMERSLDMIISILGILKAGAAYVPLDPDSPAERLAFMLHDAQVSVLVTKDEGRRTKDDEGTLVDGLIIQRLLSIQNRVPRRGESKIGYPGGVNPEADNMAYLIYTSGSTGLPKGTMIQHSSAANYIADVCADWSLTGTDRILQFASVNFDTSVEEIFSCLTCGATLVLRNDAMLSSAATFLRQCQKWVITVLDLPTAYWHELMAQLDGAAPALRSAIRLVVIGGEAARADHLMIWRRLVGQQVRLQNTYGPTEATIVTTRCDLTNSAAARSWRGILPIGHPIRNTQTYILDMRLNPCPIGVPGELYVGGFGLARGYLSHPDLTAERFVPNPFAKVSGIGSQVSEAAAPNTRHPAPATRLYKTGDLARYLPDSTIAFLGRSDHQVKIRGFRIELGEVEATLRHHPMVAEAVVVLREQAPGAKQLVAYVVPRKDERRKTKDEDADSSFVLRPSSFISELRAFLQQRLPTSMIPAAFVLLDVLPLTPQGKLDRRALPTLDALDRTTERSFVAPRTPVEQELAEIWREILGVEQVGVYDNFFALGGHSLLLIQLIARVMESFQVELALTALFEAPMIADITKLIATKQLEQADPQEIADLIEGWQQLTPAQIQALLENQ
jgi:amino acid adenylation domain-containing protein